MSPAGTSVSGPMWRKSSDMKAWQKRMTSLSLLPLGRSRFPPLPPPHGQRGERVLEDLLEGQELQDAEVDGGVGSAGRPCRGLSRCFISMRKPRFTRTVALVVDPGNAEEDDALGLDDALEDLRVACTRVTVEHERERLCDLLDGLVKLGLGRVLGLEPRPSAR